MVLKGWYWRRLIKRIIKVDLIASAFLSVFTFAFTFFYLHHREIKDIVIYFVRYYVILFLPIAIVLYRSKTEKSKRFGLEVEKTYAKKLKKAIQTLDKSYPIKLGVSLKQGGDIDIFLERHGIAIDIKAYQRVDDRIYNSLSSYKRQLSVADIVIVWLPLIEYNKIYDIRGINKSTKIDEYLHGKVYVCCGRSVYDVLGKIIFS